MTDKNLINKAIITFSDGRLCEVETFGTTIKINDTTSIYSKENNIIDKIDLSKIDWDNEKVSIKYPDNKTTYNGKINKVDGKLTGEGTIKREGVGTYVGEFKDGKFDGKGTLIYADGTTYDGYFEKGKLKDKKTIKIISGDLENGECEIAISNKQNDVDRTIKCTIKDGVIDSKGNKFILNKDDKYKGIDYESYIVNGKLNEICEVIYTNGNKYVGEFKDGEPDGQGTYIWTKTSISYKGNFVSGIPDGEGTIDYGDGKTYKITFENGIYEINYGNDIKYKGPLKDGEPDGQGTITYIKHNNTYAVTFKDGKGTIEHNGSKYEGNFKDGEFDGKGTFIYADGDKYEGDWKNGKRSGKGRYTVAEKETKKPLYTQVYDESGMMDKVEYLYEEGNSNKIVIDYRVINIALNNNDKEYLRDSKNYAYICDENGNKLKNQEGCNFELIKRCTQYQMQTRLKGSSGKLDNEERMRGGNQGLQNLIVLSELGDDYNALKRLRFEIEQNNPDWPGNTYKDIESYLNSYGLTKNKTLSEENKYVPVHSLKDDYLCMGMTTPKRTHAFFSMFDFNDDNDKIYVYDTSRIADRPEERNLMGLQAACSFYSHAQQDHGSCWFNIAITLITAAKYPEIIERIRDGQIKEIEREEALFKKNDIEFNYFELLQMKMAQEVSEHLGVEKLGKDSKMMVDQILNEEIKKKIKEKANKYLDEYDHLKCLEGRLNIYEALLVICYKKGLEVNKLGPELTKIFNKRAAEAVADKKSSKKTTTPAKPRSIV